MREAIRTGVSFGLTSGVLTTLGLIVGLYAGTRSRLAVLGGIITIALADGLSDALGMHVHEESENQHTPAQIWMATAATFVSKMLMTLSFLVPLFLFDLPRAVWISVVWGFAVLALLSYRLAASQGTAAWKVVGEHLAVAAAVVVATHWVGVWVGSVFR